MLEVRLMLIKHVRERAARARSVRAAAARAGTAQAAAALAGGGGGEGPLRRRRRRPMRCRRRLIGGRGRLWATEAIGAASSGSAPVDIYVVYNCG